MNVKLTDTITLKTALLFAAAAFLAGGGIAWLVLRQPAAAVPTQPSTFVIQQPAAGQVPTEAPPDVSKLPPAQAAVALGNWNYDGSNWVKAIEYYQQAISLGMDNADVRTDLGTAFRNSGQPQKAIEQYQIAQRENPQHENSLANTAIVYSDDLHDSVNAVKAWREYVRRFPNGDKASMAKQFLQETDSSAHNGAQSGGTLPKPTPELP